MVGVVALSRETTIAGQPADLGRVLHSGETLNVGNGAAEVLIGTRTRIVLGRDTQISFERKLDDVTALVSHGDVSLYGFKEGPSFRLRTGDLSISPSPAFETQAVIRIDDSSVVLSTRNGLLTVEQNGTRFAVPNGKAIKFAPDPQGGSQTPAGTSGGTAQAVSRVHWTRLYWCVAAGAGAGSVPALVTHTVSSTSPSGGGSDWQWGLIPGGALAGGLICGIGGGPPPPPPPPPPNPNNPPPVCTLLINGQVVDWRNPPKLDWSNNYTVSWTSQNATSLSLTARTAPGGLVPVPGNIAIPAGQLMFPVPAQKGHQRIEYVMTAVGPGGMANCEGDVMFNPVLPPECTLKADPMISYEPGKATLSWTTKRTTSLSLSMLKPRQGFSGSPTPVPITATPPLPDGSQMMNGPPLEVGGTSGTSSANRFTLKVTGPTGKTAYCSAGIYVIPGCNMSIEFFDFSVRTEKVAGYGTTAASLSAKLGPVGIAAAIVVGGLSQIAKANVDAKEACNEVAACHQKQGITGNITVNNAFGSVIGKCEWQASGFGRYTNP